MDYSIDLYFEARNVEILFLENTQLLEKIESLEKELNDLNQRQHSHLFNQ